MKKTVLALAVALVVPAAWARVAAVSVARPAVVSVARPAPASAPTRPATPAARPSAPAKQDTTTSTVLPMAATMMLTNSANASECDRNSKSKKDNCNRQGKE